MVDIPKSGEVVSIVGFTDGTTSMYTSAGGGTIGAGSHEPVVAATHAVLAALQSRIELFPPDDRVGLPGEDMVQVTLITPSGRRRAGIPVDAFWGREPSSVIDLIGAIQNWISAIRQVTPA